MSADPHNVLVLTYWGRNDALIQTYTLPYVRMIARHLPEGSKVVLLTLDKEPLPAGPIEDNIHGVSIPYRPFGMKGLFMWMQTMRFLLQLIRKERISTIHAWCTPAGMIGYLLSKLSGKRLIIDSYEPHAEAMVENGTWKPGSKAFKLLFGFEKRQTHRAAVLIAAAEGMKTYAREKYGEPRASFFVKPACVDLELFSDRNSKNPELLRDLGLEGKLICVYAGKFGGIYLDREVFDFFKVAQDHWGERFHVLLLTNHDREELDHFARAAGFDTQNMTTVFVPHHRVPDYMGLGDFAVTPVKPVPTKRYCTPIKNGEYWALGLPVIIPVHISDDSEIIEQNGIGYVWKNLSVDEYRASVEKIDQMLLKSRAENYALIRPFAENYRNFQRAEAIYKTIYNSNTV